MGTDYGLQNVLCEFVTAFEIQITFNKIRKEKKKKIKLIICLYRIMTIPLALLIYFNINFFLP